MIVDEHITDIAGRSILYRCYEATGRRWEIFKRLLVRGIVVDRGYKTACWEWTGPTSGTGRGGEYGRMTLNDTTCATHKVGWTGHNGLVPPGKQLDHKCENRRCWRDDHLELMTHKRNQKLKAQRRKEREDATPKADRPYDAADRPNHGAEMALDDCG